ncbi:MAG TPA: hypothetical protein VE046_09500 [Steroidobacteraceae bacterium]|nr:hypothetical protein [Steroidobacteraceae bacterium]
MTTPHRQKGLGALAWIALILVAACLLLAAHIWIMLHWSYSTGERAGWLQKLSNKGYICKTWEGEMALVSLPGSMPEKFSFTVWDEKTAETLKAAMGKRVTLYYEEHIWLPTSCFGDTRYFVKGLKAIEERPAPMIIPGNVAPPTQAPPQPKN